MLLWGGFVSLENLLDPTFESLDSGIVKSFFKSLGERLSMGSCRGLSFLLLVGVPASETSWMDVSSSLGDFLVACILSTCTVAS